MKVRIKGVTLLLYSVALAVWLGASSAFAQSLVGMEFMLSSPMEVAVAGPQQSPETQRLIRSVRKPFAPNKVVAVSWNGSGDTSVPIPYLKGKVPIKGKPAVYVCRNYTCKKPITDPEEVSKALLAGGK
jgi:uncharacterized protein YyaL (SSP411 family)